MIVRGHSADPHPGDDRHLEIKLDIQGNIKIDTDLSDFRCVIVRMNDEVKRRNECDVRRAPRGHLMFPHKFPLNLIQ